MQVQKAPCNLCMQACKGHSSKPIHTEIVVLATSTDALLAVDGTGELAHVRVLVVLTQELGLVL